VEGLSKDDVDDSENVIRKCNFPFLQSFLKVNTLANCVLTILELNWNQRFRDKKTKLKLYLLSSSTQLQNRSFHVVERTRTSAKFPKMKNAHAKRAKILFFVVKYTNL